MVKCSKVGCLKPLILLRCLLFVHLNVHFPVRAGVLQRVVDHVKAVDGVSFGAARHDGGSGR